MFHELASTRDETEEAACKCPKSLEIFGHKLPIQEVISLDAYKAAAQENGDFLSCLGLERGAKVQVPAMATVRCQTSMPIRDCSCSALDLP